ncbi:MAG: PEGA domain-containing protein [Deltaproteobacteria bacterium]|nr:MAG: PEGA domain-containing protein [Deltaproteobacteria bacterium]
MKLRIAIVITLVAALGAPAAADEALERARTAFDKGQSLYEQGDFAGAAAAFLEAYEARNFPAFLYNAALSYQKGKEFENAITYYERYLTEQRDVPDAERKDIEQRIALMKAEIERRKQPPPDQGDAGPPPDVEPPPEVVNPADTSLRGLVAIESVPQGAYIYLDGKKDEPLGRTPWSGTLDGEHTVLIEARGYKPRERTFTARKDRFLVLDFTLAEEDYLGWIDIRANVPGAKIYIDDKVAEFARTPYSGNLKPGKHKIWITKEGYDEYYVEVEIVPGETKEIKAELSGKEVGYINVRGRDVEKIRLYIDGKKVCDGPCRWPVAEGRHTIKITRSGYKSYSRDIDVRQKTEITVRPNLAPKPSRADAVWAYVFAAAFTGGGVWLGMQAKNLEDEIAADIDRGMPPPDPKDPRLRRGMLFAIGADAAYALGAATFATAVYYTFRDKGRPSTATTDVSSIALTPAVGPGFAGLGLEVTW